MKLEWVNHAGFLARAGAVGLLCDPWIEGFVFDNSWALISPTTFRYDDFERVTHIWFSHEHPDHFLPPNLKRIPANVRAGITVLFKETKDKRVFRFCRGLGFKAVEELPHAAWVDLAPDFSVFCQPIDRGDSWVAIRTEGHTILNLNDCIYLTEDLLKPLLTQIGKVDTLITQFSYASWWGNADEPEKWIQAAKDTLVKIEREVRVFQPRQTVLSASFVYFCHQENVFMNEHINRVEDAYAYLKQNAATDVVVLYPGDVWEPGTAWDSTVALDRYRADYRTSLQDPVKVTTSSVTLEDLVSASGSFVRTLRRNNSRLLLSRLPEVLIWLEDLEVALRFDLTGLHRIPNRPSKVYDIALGSEALRYCLRFPWGGETLMINGRFRAPAGGDHYKFLHWFTIAQANSRATYYNRDYYLGRVIQKLKRYALR
jgi:hypothetical protein